MALSGKDVLEVLLDLGFQNEGLRGSHFVLKKGQHTVLVPDEDELAERTVLGIIDQAGLSNKDVLNLLRMQKSGMPSLNSESVQPSSGGFFSRAWKSRAWAVPLAAFRILLGVLFIISALEKAPWLPTSFGWLGSFLQSVSQNPSSALIKSLVDSVLLSNLGIFGWLQFSIEAVIGICLVLGLFTVTVAFLGTLWAVFFSALAVGLPDPFVILWAIMHCFSLILMWSMRAGRCFGLDQLIARAAASRKEESGFWKFVNAVIV